jgi:hypothetical protein
MKLSPKVHSKFDRSRPIATNGIPMEFVFPKSANGDSIQPSLSNHIISVRSYKETIIAHFFEIGLAG